MCGKVYLFGNAFQSFVEALQICHGGLDVLFVFLTHARQGASSYLPARAKALLHLQHGGGRKRRAGKRQVFSFEVH